MATQPTDVIARNVHSSHDGVSLEPYSSKGQLPAKGSPLSPIVQQAVTIIRAVPERFKFSSGGSFLGTIGSLLEFDVQNGIAELLDRNAQAAEKPLLAKQEKFSALPPNSKRR